VPIHLAPCIVLTAWTGSISLMDLQHHFHAPCGNVRWDRTAIASIMEEPPGNRCPCCGSALTRPSGVSGMWDCDYHLCRARFPAFSFREPVQMPLIAEGDAPYTADREKVKSKSLF